MISNAAIDAREFARRYDREIFGDLASQIYGDSGFFNLGYWAGSGGERPRTPTEAAERLVGLHLATDTASEAAEVALVVDAGCGLGATTRMFAGHYRNAEILGVNISQPQLSAAAKRCPSARFAAMNAAAMALPSGSVDRLHSVEAAFYFDSRIKFFREIRRVLKPNGRAVLTDIDHRRGFTLHVPPANVGLGACDYESLCRASGLRIRARKDITAETSLPFADLMTRLDLPQWARLIRTGVRAYWLIELEPDPTFVDGREAARRRG